MVHNNFNFKNLDNQALCHINFWASTKVIIDENNKYQLCATRIATSNLTTKYNKIIHTNQYKNINPFSSCGHNQHALGTESPHKSIT